jgi:hypothetical protein
VAEHLLLEFRNEQKEGYQGKEPKWAKRLPPGTYVSIRVFHTRKGECPWKPGYQVLSSHDGALRVLELATNRIIRVNQRYVREIPESKPYHEIDPLTTPVNDPTMNQPDMGSAKAPQPIPIQANEYLPTHLPTAPGDQADARSAPSEAGTED